MKSYIFLTVLFLIPLIAFSQVGINTNDPSPASVLDVNSSNGSSYGGFLPPRVSLAQRNAIAVTADDDGLMVYLIEGTQRCVQIYDAILNTWDNVYCMPVNDEPIAGNVNFTGLVVEGETLTSSFNYSDTENDPAGSHNYQWFTATDLLGTDETPIPGATSSTFTVTSTQNGLYIAVQITPVATSGMSPGNAVMSDYDGPVVANAAPVVENVVITGSFSENQTLTADYDFSDAENDAEGATTFQWFYASDASGTGSAQIPGATSSTYDLDDTYTDYYIAVQVTPVAATGTLTGTPVMSAWGGPVTEPSLYAEDLFISEYVEGSSNNKAIEIANYTGVDVDLSSYKIRGYNSASSTPTYEIAISGNLPHGSVYVIKNSSSSLSFTFDLSTPALGFNGNDAVVLTTTSNTVIDIIGNTATAGGANFAIDKTLRKNAGIGPTNVYDENNFTEYPQNTVDGLGSHTY